MSGQLAPFSNEQRVSAYIYGKRLGILGSRNRSFISLTSQNRPLQMLNFVSIFTEPHQFYNDQFPDNASLTDKVLHIIRV